jgi:membrane protease YdiL (CAAX protease family)
VTNPISESHIAFQIIVGCFFAPVVETLLFQTLPIHIFTEVFIKKRNIAIFISALLFGLSHYYSLLYILITFVIGLLFAWAYLNYEERNGSQKAFWAITLAHALRNAIAALLGVFLPESIT